MRFEVGTLLTGSDPECRAAFVGVDFGCGASATRFIIVRATIQASPNDPEFTVEETFDSEDGAREYMNRLSAHARGTMYGTDELRPASFRGIDFLVGNPPDPVDAGIEVARERVEWQDTDEAQRLACLAWNDPVRFQVAIRDASPAARAALGHTAPPSIVFEEALERAGWFDRTPPDPVDAGIEAAVAAGAPQLEGTEPEPEDNPNLPGDYECPRISPVSSWSPRYLLAGDSHASDQHGDMFTWPGAGAEERDPSDADRTPPKFEEGRALASLPDWLRKIDGVLADVLAPVPAQVRAYSSRFVEVPIFTGYGIGTVTMERRPEESDLEFGTRVHEEVERRRQR